MLVKERIFVSFCLSIHFAQLDKRFLVLEVGRSNCVVAVLKVLLALVRGDEAPAEKARRELVGGLEVGLDAFDKLLKFERRALDVTQVLFLHI